MKAMDDVVSFMDVLDFDEEIVDMRLKTFMDRKSFTSRHLSNIIHLLNYKCLLNIKESDECDNESEFEFVGKLIENADETNIDVICKIVDITLTLNPSTIVNKSEHLLQQLLSTISIHLENIDSEDNHVALLLCLKLCDSILEAVSRAGDKLVLPFLEIPLEKIILHSNEQLKKHFLTITVKRFFDGVSGYNILDRIWNHIENLVNNMLISLKVLCILSNYYLPLPDKKGEVLFESTVVMQASFWEVALYSLSSDDASIRKLAIYLTKRAVDCLEMKRSRLEIKTPTVTVLWVPGREKEIKKMWDNFFILIDSLEEKQSNIVLPSLQLFDTLKDLGHCWLNCAYNIGLQHDNLQVKVQCAKYRLQTPTYSDRETIILLEALNDMNIYDNEKECAALQQNLEQHLQDCGSFINIIKNIVQIKWSPVPIYNLSSVLGAVNVNIVDNIARDQLTRLMSDLVKVQCNNIIIRKAFHRNLSHLIGNCCYSLSWKELLYLYNQLETDLWRNEETNPFNILIRDKLIMDDLKIFFKDISQSHLNIDFVFLYLSGHEEQVSPFLDFINEMYGLVHDVNKNLNTTDCLKEAIFLTHMIKKVNSTNYTQIYWIMKEKSYMLLEYAFNLLSANVEDVDNVLLFLDNLHYIYELINNKNETHKLYNLAISKLPSSNNICTNIYSICILNTICSSVILNQMFEMTIIEIDNFIDILNKIEFQKKSKIEGYGRLRNVFNSKACEVMYVLLKMRDFRKGNQMYVDILNYTDAALECGGYSCLKWILSVVDIILPNILDVTNIQFDLSNFLHRTWNDIEAIKTNRLYTECIESFVKLLLNDALLKKPMYNNIVITYCSKIIEYASVKNIPLYYLVDVMEKRDVLTYGHAVYIFSELLLATAVPRKDQRITENVIVDLTKRFNFGNVRAGLYTNFHIKHKSLLVLSKIEDGETVQTITSLILKKINELFKNKHRYHSNSTLHRTLLAGLQHIMFIFLKHRSNYVESVAQWCIEFLGKLPHQTSIRPYLEWYICLFYYYKNQHITSDILQILKAQNVPVLSQFMILYWLIMHKIKIGVCQMSEFELVMNTLMENTMGPTYSIRMYAQYLSKKIHEKICNTDNIDTSVYDQTVKIIDKTLLEAAKLKEKSFDKLLKDVLIHHFDIIEHLTPCAIYNGMFLHEELNNEAMNEDFALSVYEDMMKSSSIDAFFDEWRESVKSQDDIMKFSCALVRNADLSEGCKGNDVGTIQKKYIPWKSMSDIDVVDMKRNESSSELIVVASLIDKLPNLGGLARTSEVFGVHTYVIDSVRHLEDKQFQGLSVSAERWVNVVEVRPGRPLVEYLTLKKSEGYTIVAAEQTSSSVSLQTYKFPKRTLLLLGHEKEGVPCDLLPFMDVCVEIPQQGVVRSLNVHVTAAIFVWEYSRQIIL